MKYCFCSIHFLKTSLLLPKQNFTVTDRIINTLSLPIHSTSAEIRGFQTVAREPFSKFEKRPLDTTFHIKENVPGPATAASQRVWPVQHNGSKPLPQIMQITTKTTSHNTHRHDKNTRDYNQRKWQSKLDFDKARSKTHSRN